MKKLFLGIDLGSTTIKIICINSKKEILYSIYERHFSDIKKKLKFILDEMLDTLTKKFGKDLILRLILQGHQG